MYYQITYHEPLFRPPSEAYSLILQPTIGCSWNRCAFCEMYTTKKFSIRDIEEVKAEVRSVNEDGENVRKVFLADGNAMVLPLDYILELLGELRETFPKLIRVSAYALPKDLLAKTDEELSAIREAGLKLIYVGIESGDDEVLQMVNKGETHASTVEGLLKSKKAGIKSSVMILSGLGGKKYSRQHAENSAKVVNAIQPEFLSTLVLSYPHGMEHFKKRFKGDFEPCEIPDLLEELKIFISNTELEQSIFRSDHASNYLILKGTLGREKERMLQEIDAALENPGMAGLRPEWLRGL
ncbi:MAG: radical SAM protein [Bacteroidales bacterium]|nr:radical SAM protein [Bacteroidales bacterium]